MQQLNISFRSPHLSNPRQGADPQPDGTIKLALVVDCDLDLAGDAGPGSPLAAAIEEVNEIIANYPFDKATFLPV